MNDPAPPPPEGYKLIIDRGVTVASLLKGDAIFEHAYPEFGWYILTRDSRIHPKTPVSVAVLPLEKRNLEMPSPPEDPKGEAGKTKAQLQLIPPVFNTQVAKALACGAAKYGPWNWREHKVEIMTYLGAMKRHIDQVVEREDFDPESNAHHLGHVAAGCAIVLDAMEHGTLVDNRPRATRD